MSERTARTSDEAWSGVERAVPIVHALDALLDQMERRLKDEEPEAVESLADLLPLSTGLLPLDSVLGGDLWRGTVTSSWSCHRAQDAALLYTVARHVSHK